MSRYFRFAATRARLARIDRQRIGGERRAEVLAGAWQDLRYAARGLRTRPGFTAAVVITLALGIGANAAMFGIVDRLLLRPPPGVRDVDRLARVYFTRQFQRGVTSTVPYTDYPAYVNLREHLSAFDQIAAYTQPDPSTLGSGAQREKVMASLATSSFFPMLGVRPALGRFFAADEDRLAAGAAVAVLSHDFWRRRFASDRRVLGQQLVIDRVPYTIIGITPRDFSGIDVDANDVWLPLSTGGNSAFGPNWYQRGAIYALNIVGHLRPGATRERASAEATVAYRDDPKAYLLPDTAAFATVASIIAGRGPAGKTKELTIAMMLAGVSVIVLLIACANVANMLLARALSRRREIAVRIALGIGRGRLIRQLLAEALLLAAIAGAFALALAAWGREVLRALLFPTGAWRGAPLDARVLTFTILATLATGIVTGLVPALQTTSPDLSRALKSGVREGTIARSPLRAALLIVQAALSVVLLVGAGLFVRSLHNVRAIDLGLEADRLLVVSVDLEGRAYADGEVAALYDRMAERLRVFPGVERVTLSSAMPFVTQAITKLFVPARAPTAADVKQTSINAVEAGFFATVGAPVVRGRAFAVADRRGAPPVAMVNEALARTIWPGESALGQCIKLGAANTPCVSVVGVVHDGPQFRLRDQPTPLVYVPLDQSRASASRVLTVRTRGDPSNYVNAVRGTLAGMAPNMPFVNVRAYTDTFDRQVRPWRLGATLFSLFGALALALAALGLYGVIAFTVTQRTFELGVRAALGAQAGDAMRLVIVQGTRLAAIGVAVGVVIALASGRLIESQLFGVSPRDPIVFAVVTCTLLLVALAASLVPAWRATRVDPVIALRAD